MAGNCSGSVLGWPRWSHQPPRSVTPGYGAVSPKVEGRTHRDGKFTQVDWALAAGATDQTIAETVIGRIRSMKALNGDDISTIDAIQAALSAL